MTTLEIISTTGFIAALILLIIDKLDYKKLKKYAEEQRTKKQNYERLISEADTISKACKESPELVDVLKEVADVYNTAEPCDVLTISVCIGPDKDTHVTYSVRR